MKNSRRDQINIWAQELGFQAIGIAKPDVQSISTRFSEMIQKGYHANMNYLVHHKWLRENPALLLPNIRSIIMARMDYLQTEHTSIPDTLNNPQNAYVARYALGQDYHRLIRKRLKKLAEKITSKLGSFDWRPFADSAPIFEKPLAQKAGLGWQGKNTLIINPKAGSYFFLGTLYTSLDLREDEPTEDHCGSCTACLDICPTKAFPKPYQLDARLCISYWTIEDKGEIPEFIRENMGNRVFGCDDCQMVCPWNRFAKLTRETAFLPRHQLDQITLLELFSWDEKTYLEKTSSSAIRRIGYEGWKRNLIVGLGNSQDPSVIPYLQAARESGSELIQTHIDWAIQKLKRLYNGSNK